MNQINVFRFNHDLNLKQRTLNQMTEKDPEAEIKIKKSNDSVGLEPQSTQDSSHINNSLSDLKDLSPNSNVLKKNESFGDDKSLQK